ncbi:MAG: TnsA endonuclease N-terminal domain-containing protein [Candidatus Peribacteraceae bacterium]|nr:TnsA endonuclease N-terminal domain-containing protein [Candidatus Peribacteraceae bacterium]
MSYMSNKIGKNDTVYRPKNDKKYIGKSGKAICRSSWETIFCRWADHNPSVIEWASEPIAVPYIDKMTKDYRGMPKKRRYYPDFLVKILNSKGTIDTYLIEVKPYKETIPPRAGKKSQKTKIYEAKTWGTNQAKWRSAEALCKRRGWHFKILTERELIKK